MRPAVAASNATGSLAKDFQEPDAFGMPQGWKDLTGSMAQPWSPEVLAAALAASGNRPTCPQMQSCSFFRPVRYLGSSASAGQPCHSYLRNSWPRHSWPRHRWPRHRWPRHRWPRHSLPRHSWPRHSCPPQHSTWPYLIATDLEDLEMIATCFST